MNNSDDGFFMFIAFCIWSVVCFGLGGVFTALDWTNEIDRCKKEHDVYSCEWITQPKTNESTK